ncbi:MAG TPA: glycogen debranching N-terminal domain-containing protein [Acidimicrobiales bacterium]|nr:glycogen debranching N-terminal domain-containing protein [Acidimicrobiales bacterium]
MSDRWTLSEESEPVSPATITLVEGASFTICDLGGDIVGRGVEGLYVADTRICSGLVLTVDDQKLEPLTVASRSPFSASFVARTVDRALLVFRDVWIGQGMCVDLRLRNLDHEPRTAVVRLAVGADLADLFDVKRGQPVLSAVHRTVNGGVASFADLDGKRGLVVRACTATAAADGSLEWVAELDPGTEWSSCVELAALRGGVEVPPRHRCGSPPAVAPPSTRQAAWEGRLPSLRSDVPGLATSFARTGTDLGALRIFDPGQPDPVIAAGAPWYMTLFGRDSLLTSWMALLIDPSLALATLRTLARLQGTEDRDDNEEQPGKILHEVRFSPGPSVALADGEVYYGSVDATPLFVMLVHEMWRWGTPLDDLLPLLPAVDAALDWVAGPGDPDGDGYVEYERRSPDGLVNQGWKDSWDGVSFADRRIAEPPIALAEVQGYAYAAWRAGAALAHATGDEATAAARDRRAHVLRRRFENDFWLPHQEAFALALDRDKRPVDAVASNMGHCLWTGIVTDPDQAAAVARHLVSPAMNTGWGIRTLAEGMGRFNPLSYHNGSVWPHDTAICVAGLRRAGFADEAARVAAGLLAAADASDGRPPELFAGLTRDELPVPVPYPASCSPQAWASAAPLLLVRALLGLEPDAPGGRIELNPVLPAGTGYLQVADVPLAGGRVTIESDDGAVALRGLRPGLAVVQPAERAP